MPAKFLMSWEQHLKRWSKMYKGTRYRVFCAELGLPLDYWTKEGSYQAANQWWTKRRAEIDMGAAALHPHADEIRRLEARLYYITQHGLTDEKGAIETEIGRVRELPAPVAQPDDEEVVPNVPDVVTPPRLTDAERRALSEEVWEDRLHREPLVPADKTIGALTERWVTIKFDEARAGFRSHNDADSHERGITHFVAHVGPSSPADSIVAGVWHGWFLHVHGKLNRNEWSADTCHKYFTISRSFVKWMYQSDIVDRLPKNIADAKYKFAKPHRVPPTFTDAEVKDLLAAAKGVHRLLFLLMLNTGATQTDIADLTKDEIDFGEGRLTRRRSKMVKTKASREVSYKLWPETAALLEAHLSPHPTLALTTKSGSPWTWDETTDARKHRGSDNVASVFNNIVRKLAGVKTGKGSWSGKSVKLFRKTSSTKIGNNSDYKDLTKFFLGHKETETDIAHYVDLTQERLDAAVMWLREVYGITTT